MSSKTDHANLALRHIGHGQVISNIDTEESEEARTIRTYYDIVKNVCLTEGHWKFAIKEANLSLVAAAPNDRWGYSYRIPNDNLQILRVVSRYRQDQLDEIIEYKETSDASGGLLYTDYNPACIEYVCKDPAETAQNSYYDMALSYLLASHIVPSITAGDTFGLQGRMLEQYNYYINKSREKEYNKGHEKEAKGGYLAARDDA